MWHMLFVQLSYHLHVDRNTTYCRSIYNIVCKSIWFFMSSFKDIYSSIWWDVLRSLILWLAVLSLSVSGNVPFSASCLRFWGMNVIPYYVSIFHICISMLLVTLSMHAKSRSVCLSICWWHSSRVHWVERMQDVDK